MEPPTITDSLMAIHEFHSIALDRLQKLSELLFADSFPERPNKINADCLEGAIREGAADAEQIAKELQGLIERMGYEPDKR